MSKSRDIADSAATINYIDTVTSNVQDQIDNLDPLPSQTGNAGNFLTTDGTSASWGAVAPAGLVLLGTINASDTADVTIDTIFTATYSKYLIEVTDLRVLTTNTTIQIEREISSVYGNYNFVQSENQQGTWSNKTPNITASLNAHSSQRGASFTMTVYDPANSLSVNTATMFGVAYSGYDVSSPTIINNFLLNFPPASLTGLKFKASSGNISGVFKIYGVTI